MATSYVYNGFWNYDTKDGNPGTEPGIRLWYAGVPFWLPFGQTRAIPNWTLREVDHAASSPGASGEATGIVQYREVNVPGDRIAKELTTNQDPIQNAKRGIIVVDGKATGNAITVEAGCDERGNRIDVEVPEKLATKAEMARATQLAEDHKKSEIQAYFQSKRAAMAGKQGHLTPEAYGPMVRVWMEELGIEDLDDVTAHAKNQGMSKEFLADLLKGVTESASEAVAGNLVGAVKTVRANQKAQFSTHENKHVDQVLSPEEAERRKNFGIDMAARRAAAKAAKEEPVETVK